MKGCNKKIESFFQKTKLEATLRRDENKSQERSGCVLAKAACNMGRSQGPRGTMVHSPPGRGHHCNFPGVRSFHVSLTPCSSLYQFCWVIKLQIWPLQNRTPKASLPNSNLEERKVHPPSARPTDDAAADALAAGRCGGGAPNGRHHHGADPKGARPLPPPSC
jgi:hypothetical protein